ncbi:MAG: AsmA family protein [Acidobacteriaceae bacterium]
MKRGLRMVGIAVAVLLVFALVAPFFVNANSFLPAIQKQLTTALGRKVTLGNLSLSIFEGGLKADNLVIADDPAFSNQPFLQAKQLRIGVKLIPLIFHKQLNITRFEVVDPQIQLLQSANGRWNYSSLGNTAATESRQTNGQSTEHLKSLSVGKILITGGRVSVGTVPASTAARVYDKVKVEIDNFRFGSEFPFTMAASLPAEGTVKVTGKAGPINPADSSLTPFVADAIMKHVDPVAAGFVQKQAGLAGLLDITAHVASDGGSLVSTGTGTGTQMRFSEQGTPASTPVELNYNAAYNLASENGRILKAAMTAGKLAANLSGTFVLTPGHPQIQLQLTAPNLSVDGLQSLLPAFGVKLPSGSVLQGGTLSTNLAIAGPVENLVITGPITLNNTQLSGFDLGSKLAAISVLNKLGGGTGNATDIQTLKADLRITQQAVQTSNILAVVPSLGQATGSGTVLPNGALNFNMLAKLNTTSGIGGLATGLMSALPGVFGKNAATAAANGFPLTITGTTSNPVFRLDTSKLGKSMTGKQQQPAQPNNLGNALQNLFGKH